MPIGIKIWLSDTFKHSFRNCAAGFKTLGPSAVLLEKLTFVFGQVILFGYAVIFKTCRRKQSVPLLQIKVARCPRSTYATKCHKLCIPLHLRWISSILSAAVSLWMMWHYQSLVLDWIIKRTSLEHQRPVISGFLSTYLAFSETGLGALPMSWMFFCLQ